MNCDEAFDALTECDGRESDELQRHMNMCPRCRQMREVLSPALAMFNSRGDSALAESFEPSDRDEAAESIRQKFLSVEAVQMARETAQSLAGVGKRNESGNARKESKWLMLQVAAAAAAVAIVFTVFAPIASGPERHQSAADPAQLCLLKDKAELERLKGNSHAVVSSCVACHFETNGNCGFRIVKSPKRFLSNLQSEGSYPYFVLRKFFRHSDFVLRPFLAV